MMAAMCKNPLKHHTKYLIEVDATSVFRQAVYRHCMLDDTTPYTLTPRKILATDDL